MKLLKYGFTKYHLGLLIGGLTMSAYWSNIINQYIIFFISLITIAISDLYFEENCRKCEDN